MVAVPFAPQAAPRATAAPLDPERARFYALLWGEAEGYVQVAAGLPAADILARGWPLAADEHPSNPAELGDKMLMLLWSRETGDSFKAAGRPHTGKVFHWPSEARALDRYVEKLAADFDNVYSRKYLAATPQAAKWGEAPALAQVVQVEDAPAELPAGVPPFTFTLETSDYSRQGFYLLPRALPWAQVETLAAGLAALLRADSGGKNPAQYTRVPTTRNTKARAGRYRVRLVEGGGPVSLAELARAALPGGLADLGRGASRDKSQLSRPEGSADKTPAALDLSNWAGLPDGAALMASGRYRYLFGHRPQLARLVSGRDRVTILGDDTGSQQVAALVSNLLTTGRPAATGGPLVPGLGAPPLAEVRAVALFWRETLRPECDLDRYRLDVDRLIARYTPPGYAPEATRGIAQARAAAPAPLPASKGRPIGDRSAGAELLARILEALPVAADGYARTRRADLAQALGRSRAMVGCYLADLRGAGRVETRTEARALAVRVLIKSPRRADCEGANRPAARRTVALKNAPAGNREIHTPPPSCPGPVPAAGVAAQVEAPAWGSDADRLALAGELVAAGFPGRAWFVALELADREHRDSFLAELRPLVEAERAALEARALERFTAELVAQALGRAGVSAAPQAATATPATPAPAYTVAELDAAEGRILEAVALIHAERVDRLDRETGEVVARKVPATRRRVAELLPDMPPALFDAAWARYADPWGRERRRLWRLDVKGLAAAARTAARKHAQAVTQGSSRAPYLGALATLAAEVCARRGVDPVAPTKRQARKGKAEARAAAQGRAERLPGLLRLLEVERPESATQAPPAPAWACPPPDDVPHPAEALGQAPAPATPSVATALADRVRNLAPRPRVQLATRPQVEAPAQVEGYTVEECDAWLAAQGWRRGPGGDWVAPPVMFATAAD